MGFHVAQKMRAARLVFWDFDGVIKDSVDVKSAAFEHLFLPYGEEISRRVRSHHEANGGVSRFEKMKLYLDWAGEPVTQAQLETFCERFAKLVFQAVIDAPWVPGVPEYIQRHYTNQYYVLVTATPQDEIEQIIDALDLAHCFREVYGAPAKKSSAIGSVLRRLQFLPEQALMIGDAETDRLAAQENAVPFLLRRTRLNFFIQASYGGQMFDDLSHE